MDSVNQVMEMGTKRKPNMARNDTDCAKKKLKFGRLSLLPEDVLSMVLRFKYDLDTIDMRFYVKCLQEHRHNAAQDGIDWTHSFQNVPTSMLLHQPSMLMYRTLVRAPMEFMVCDRCQTHSLRFMNLRGEYSMVARNCTCYDTNDMQTIDQMLSTRKLYWHQRDEVRLANRARKIQVAKELLENHLGWDGIDYATRIAMKSRPHPNLLPSPVPDGGIITSAVSDQDSGRTSPTLVLDTPSILDEE